MASTEMQRLWKLAQIDNQILEVRKRAASLDIGQKVQAEIDALHAQDAEIGGKYRALASERKDLELAQQSLEDKLKKFDKQLYGGSVVNPREVENIEKEIANLKKTREKQDDRLLELMEEEPPAKEAADKILAQIEVKKQQLAEKRKAAVVVKGQLEEAFKTLNAKRPEATKGISPTVLAKYEAIRQKHGGIGMVEVDRRAVSCGGCGTKLPERTIEALKDEKMASCEACHRILYYTEGVV